jgi:hypothetical protein
MNLQIVFAGALFLAAVSSAIRSWRLARWVAIDAEVVLFELVGPLGLSPTKFAHQLELQRRGQGVMGPEIVYHAELVYVVSGVPHRAELTFDGPPDRKFPIRFNPKNPSEYTPDQPDFSRAIGLASLGFASLFYSLF